MEPTKHGNAERSDRLLTPAQIADRLVVTRGMVYKLLRIGQLVPIYVGRLPRVESAELDAYIARQRAIGRRP